MPESNISFYDIISSDPIQCFAPNPWKVRYALNFKQLDYKTSWTDLLDIVELRTRLGVAPNRKYPDGKDYYTLPVIEDHMNLDLDTKEPKAIGDSFEIAMYLDQRYPDHRLIPEAQAPVLKAFNIYVDSVFTPFTLLCHQDIPFRPETAEKAKTFFAERVGKSSYEELWVLDPVERKKHLAIFKEKVDELYKAYSLPGHPYTGLWLHGEEVSYADFIVGSWIQLISRTCPEWVTDIKFWHDGHWEKILKALEPYAANK